MPLRSRRSARTSSVRSRSVPGSACTRSSGGSSHPDTWSSAAVRSLFSILQKCWRHPLRPYTSTESLPPLCSDASWSLPPVRGSPGRHPAAGAPVMKIPADWCNRRRSCTPSAAFQSALCHPFPPALKNAPACLKSVLSHPQRYYFQKGFRSDLPKSGFCPSYSAPARPAALPQGWSYGSYRQSAPHIEAAHWSASYSSLKWRRRSPYSSDPAASCGR